MCPIAAREEVQATMAAALNRIQLSNYEAGGRKTLPLPAGMTPTMICLSRVGSVSSFHAPA
jgi:hypothetical protein